ncbi:Glyoxalase/Bleomycin resistance protein/Dihydroxybiphenyl dioxygenase [Tricladium varicosporioides]|nr:Glyoxalase/Bleomycin resistance protein/Dihydroxybiphenyl dioxygenase [Hymenoscyphus varicosporioides]
MTVLNKNYYPQKTVIASITNNMSSSNPAPVLEAAPEPTPQRVPPAINSPAWFRIPASDVARAQAFYAAVFGWHFLMSNPGYPSSKFMAFTIPGSSMMGGIAVDEDTVETRGARGGAVMIYLKVEDVGKALEKVVESGGKVAQESHIEGGHTELGSFRDTEGNLIGILRWLI